MIAKALRFFSAGSSQDVRRNSKLSVVAADDAERAYRHAMSSGLP
jgi:hypothetical protein